MYVVSFWHLFFCTDGKNCKLHDCIDVLKIQMAMVSESKIWCTQLKFLSFCQKERNLRKILAGWASLFSILSHQRLLVSSFTKALTGISDGIHLKTRGRRKNGLSQFKWQEPWSLVGKKIKIRGDFVGSSWALSWLYYKDSFWAICGHWKIRLMWEASMVWRSPRRRPQTPRLWDHTHTFELIIAGGCNQMV